MNLTTASPTDTATALTAGAPTSILVSAGCVRVEVKDADDAWQAIEDVTPPGITIPVLPGTAVRGTLIQGEAATVTITQG